MKEYFATPDGEIAIRINGQVRNITADDDELIIFEYWIDGITKPKEIAKDLGIDVKEVYNITKRLERRLPKIQTHVANII